MDNGTANVGVPVRVPKQFNRAKLLAMLARLLSGHEIMKQTCAELRSRPLVGIGSDPPMTRVGAAIKKPDLFRREPA